MGRKPAPQPLALSDTTRATAGDGAASGTRQTIRQVHTPTSATSSPSSPLRSQRSPLSPFRLGSKRSSRERARKDEQSNGDARKPPLFQRTSPSPSPVKSETPTLSQSQNPRQNHLDRDTEAASPYLPLAAALHDTPAEASSNTVAPGGTRTSRGAENPDMATATLRYTGMETFLLKKSSAA